MSPGKRKREVSSCMPCYTRKQKCDRQYPCNRCSRRRQPELCVYSSTPSPTSTIIGGSERLAAVEEDMNNITDQSSRSINPNDYTISTSQPSPASASEFIKQPPSSLAEAFGYFGHSGLNTMALVHQLDPQHSGSNEEDILLPPQAITDVRNTLDKMLRRPVIDFLIRFFMAEVNWIDQLVHPPWFLSQYQAWWSANKVSLIAEVEFAVLFLRICCYASHFLPSPSHTVDNVKGISLPDVRRSCEQVINSLIPVCIEFNRRGSLVRVQHVAFAGLASLTIGRMNAFWDAMSCASRVAQQIGLHLSSAASVSGLDEISKEMRRRTFCNLYIWDTSLAKRLDRAPFLPDNLSANNLPRMRLHPSPDMESDAPDGFMARFLLAQLAQFGRNHELPRVGKYDPMKVEERYENFGSQFLQSLPPAFALEPDKQWDEPLPMLPLQRQLLHIGIFEFLCWNFRSALLQPSEINHLPGYKQILIALNKRALAVAALQLLQHVTDLHKMMGGYHTQYSGIILPMFEAAVPLLSLCSDPSFPGDIVQARPYTIGFKTDPLGAGICSVDRTECMQAVKSAMGSLQTLADVSRMAEIAGETLNRLIEKVENSGIHAMQEFTNWSTKNPGDIQASNIFWELGQGHENEMAAFQSNGTYMSAGWPAVDSNWEQVLQNLGEDQTL